VVGFNWNESQTSFIQGKIGMWIDGIGFAPPVEDPTKSRVVGKVGYAVMPPGPKARTRRPSATASASRPRARRRSRVSSTRSGRRAS
jgi:ABC-type glycerol-3-phosphate transport system substrate-binding protein